MAIQDELIETAFQDEYNRLKQAGLESLLAQRIDLVFYKLFRSGYIRGHSQRSKEVHQEERMARASGVYPMGVDIKYEDNTLVLDGKVVPLPTTTNTERS